jgi:hemerythrin-like domain-containing protein
LRISETSFLFSESEIELMKCIEVVIQDHAIIRKGLDILDTMVTAMEDGGRIEIADAARMVSFLHAFADEYHQTTEENMLFPLLLRATPDDNPLHQMTLEHTEERRLLSHIDDALKSKRAMDFVRMSRRLAMLLRNHFNEEDVVLYELGERALSNEEDTMIVTEFMKNRVSVASHEDLSRLESKYAARQSTGGLTAAAAVLSGKQSLQR